MHDIAGAGCGQLGGYLMLPFFVTIGAAAGSLSTILTLGWTFAFIAVQLTVHVVFSVTAGRLLGIPMDAILTGVRPPKAPGVGGVSKQCMIDS